MTRTWISDSDQRWVMLCDQLECTTRSEPFPEGHQPDLSLFAERGWFIAKKFGDTCPQCLAAGVQPTAEAHSLSALMLGA